MTRLFLATIAALALAGGSIQAQATGGGNAGLALTPTVDCTFIYARDASEQRWLRALILWRAPSEPVPATPVSEEQRREARRQFRAAQAMAEDSGWTFAGGWGAGVFRDASYDATRLYVTGQRFDMPLRDSALVAVVALPNTGDSPARVSSATYVPAVVPQEFWPTSRQRGDTLLLIHTPPGRAEALLLAHLRANPMLRAVLR
jgi:hypothetical protein